ncbi:MAG: hypothetical protein WKF84_04885, partial [Pyrinomonadaceae bacterium]
TYCYPNYVGSCSNRHLTVGKLKINNGEAAQDSSLKSLASDRFGGALLLLVPVACLDGATLVHWHHGRGTCP